MAEHVAPGSRIFARPATGSPPTLSAGCPVRARSSGTQGPHDEPHANHTAALSREHPVPEPTERWRNRISTACGLIASVFLAGMLLLTVADVVLRALVKSPTRGVYDLIELLLAGTFFCALPCVFLRDENILVNSIDDFAPRWVPTLKRVANLLA